MTGPERSDAPDGELSAKLDLAVDTLVAIWLYVDWRLVTKQLTTEQKELWADVVDAADEPDGPGPKADRWWTND